MAKKKTSSLPKSITGVIPILPEMKQVQEIRIPCEVYENIGNVNSYSKTFNNQILWVEYLEFFHSAVAEADQIAVEITNVTPDPAIDAEIVMRYSKIGFGNNITIYAYGCPIRFKMGIYLSFSAQTSDATLVIRGYLTPQ